MVLARYKCSVAFPSRIPQLLADRGFSVQPGKWMSKAPPDSKEFGFTIADRDCAVDLSGGFVGGSQPGFLLVTIPTWKPWGFQKRNAFYQRVHEALITCGAELWRDHPSNA
jgi:hypothetical protein